MTIDMAAQKGRSIIPNGTISIIINNKIPIQSLNIIKLGKYL